MIRSNESTGRFQTIELTVVHTKEFRYTGNTLVLPPADLTGNIFKVCCMHKLVLGTGYCVNEAKGTRKRGAGYRRDQHVGEMQRRYSWAI